MTIDYHRMEWQYWANRVAWWIRVVCILMLVDEVASAFRYHFPWWDYFAMVFTTIMTIVVNFVHEHTKMWRFDL